MAGAFHDVGELRQTSLEKATKAAKIAAFEAQNDFKGSFHALCQFCQ
jgi:hypothetical protein